VLEKKAGFRLPDILHNSLEEASIRLYPEIRQIKHALAGAGVKTILMSGSGPAVFGIVSSRKEALSVRRKLRTRNKVWQIFVTKTI
jgi:4-diphosphocytidyl-2-C-methyl-D-erythritol kinase